MHVVEKGILVFSFPFCRLPKGQGPCCALIELGNSDVSIIAILWKSLIGLVFQDSTELMQVVAVFTICLGVAGCCCSPVGRELCWMSEAH